MGILDSNSKGLSYTLGVNQFADLTADEFTATYMGLKKPTAPYGELPYLGRHNASRMTLPASVDWTSNGAVTPVKTKGSAAPAGLSRQLAHWKAHGRSLPQTLCRSVSSSLWTATRWIQAAKEVLWITLLPTQRKMRSALKPATRTPPLVALAKHPAARQEFPREV